MSPTDESGSVEEFLQLLAEDEELRNRVDSVGNRNLLAVAVALGKERGLRFTSEQLAQALTDRLRLEETAFDEDAEPGQCHTRSGCRSPCMYCGGGAPPPEIMLEE